MSEVNELNQEWAAEFFDTFEEFENETAVVPPARTRLGRSDGLAHNPRKNDGCNALKARMKFSEE
jgi:hypothetical protein